MRTVLIIEDSDDDALLLKRTLKKCGIQNPVSTAKDAAAALAFLDSNTPCPGIIFVDLRMPGITGLDLLSKLKARPDCADVLFFVVSAHDNLERVRQSYGLGANSFVSKP